jgi:hypothetical protein
MTVVVVSAGVVGGWSVAAASIDRRSDADGCRFDSPQRSHLVGGAARLAGAGVGGGLALHRGQLLTGRVAALAPVEVSELVGHHRVDLGGALGEHGEQLGRHARDLRLAVDDRFEGDAVSMGELGA